MTEKEALFKEVYRSNYSNIMRLCLGYVGGNKSLANDIVQDTFVKVWENLEGFKGKSKISTWIYRIAVNTCLLYLRNEKYKKVQIDHNVLQEPTDHSPEAMDTSNKLNKMYHCINELSEQNRAIILLELEGTPQKEIAEVMGQKHEAIRTRVHRIKKELLKCISNE